MWYNPHTSMNQELDEETTIEEFSTKKEATDFVSKCYKDFYKRNITSRKFTERLFAKKINVSSSLLNDLRNGNKKALEVESNIKILKGIGKEEMIIPTLKVISPECYKILYEDGRPDPNKFVLIDEKNEFKEFVKLYTSKIYGHILSVIFTDVNDEVTVEDINKISLNGASLLAELEERGILEVSNGIVKPSKKLRLLLGNKGIELSQSKTLEQTELFLNIINPHDLEKSKEPGYNSTLTLRLHKEDFAEIMSMLEKVREKGL